MLFWNDGDHDDDTATDGYRRATCDELPPQWELVSGTLPVVRWSNVEVRCKEGGLIGKTGTLRCNNPGIFGHDKACPINSEYKEYGILRQNSAF